MNGIFTVWGTLPLREGGTTFRPIRKERLAMNIWSILSMLFVGLIVGVIARFLLPGGDSLGLLGTSIVGIVGSFVGGFVGSLIKRPADGNVKFQPASFGMSIVGAILTLLILRMFR
jgi:uncharacterized membrane protein YeaQ/YmgE (transglycosylase-associated protein family)